MLKKKSHNFCSNTKMGNNACSCYKDNKQQCYICDGKYCSSCGKNKLNEYEHKHMCRNCLQVLTFKKGQMHDCKCKACLAPIGSYVNTDMESRYCRPCYAKMYGFTCLNCNVKGVKTDIHQCICVICKKEKVKTAFGSCTTIIEFDEKNNIHKYRNVCLCCIEKRNGLCCSICRQIGLKHIHHICKCYKCKINNVSVRYGQEGICNLCHFNKNVENKVKYIVIHQRKINLLPLKIKGEDILSKT